MTNPDDHHDLTIRQDDSSYSLKNHRWPQFLRGPDRDLLEKLYIPALSEAGTDMTGAVRISQAASFLQQRRVSAT